MRNSELRRTLLAFTSILLIDPQNQNEMIISNLNLILNQIIQIAEKMDTQKEKKDIIIGVDYDEDEDEEDKRDEYLTKMLKEADNTDDELDDGLEEDEDDEEWDEFSNLNAISPLDKQCEILYLRDVFTHIQQTNREYYNRITSLIDDESKIKLENYIKNAEKRQTLKTTPIK
jgi:hypothetical protein